MLLQLLYVYIFFSDRASLYFFPGNHADGRGRLVPEDLEHLSAWVSDLAGTVNEVENLNEKFLHPEGHLENILIGERFREKFPKLLPENYDPDSFQFRATSTERAATSQFYFATGLFDRKGEQLEFCGAFGVD